MIMEKVPLYRIAHARSGDKGSSSNIGVISYTPSGYAFLFRYLTAELVHAYFSSLKPSRTIRYELPNLEALNFVIEGILDGGGSRSLRFDSQGKALGQALLEMIIEVPAGLVFTMQRGHYE